MTLADLQNLINSGATPEEIKAALAEVDDAALAQLGEAARDRFNELSGGEDAPPPGDEQLAEMEQLADINDTVKGEGEARDAAAAEATQKVSALHQRMNPPEENIADEDTTGGDDGEPGDGDPEDEDPDGDDGGTPATPAPQGRQLVNAAAGKRGTVKLSAVKAKAPKAKVPPARQRASILAAADVPNQPVGAQLDLAGLTAAAMARFAGMPSGFTPNVHRRAGIAQIVRPFAKDLQQDSGEDGELMGRAADESRVPGGSLLAAGGWCAPSETLYDLCAPETTDGILSVPEFQVKRGGIRFAESPSFADIYAGNGFIQTEAQNIAGTAKPCYEIGCPDFDEVRLDAVGLCITAGILQAKGYPEMVQRVIQGALTAHAHKVNAHVIAQMEALSTGVTATMAGFGAWADSLAAFELQAVDVRYKYRLAKNALLEGVVPEWFRPILRADILRRNGVDPRNGDAGDAMLDAHFRAHRVNVQWVVDWQDAFVNAGNTGLGGAVAATAFPTTVKALLYPAGTFTKGVTDIIQLDGIYDSTNIRTNSYTALFSEEGVLVARRCMEARVVTLPEICAAGRSGAQVAYDCTP